MCAQTHMLTISGTRRTSERGVVVGGQMIHYVTNPHKGETGLYFGCNCCQTVIFRELFEFPCLSLSQLLLLLLHAAQGRVVKTASCNEDVSLPCQGASTTQFVSVTWYKVWFRSVVSVQLVQSVVSDAGFSGCFKGQSERKRGDHQEKSSPQED